MIQAYSPSTYPRRPEKVSKTVEKWILYLVVLGIAGVSLYWFIVGKGKTFELNLTAKKGTVEYRNNEKEGWQTVNNLPLKMNVSIELRTLADSEAVVSISDGSKMNLGSYSRIVLTKNQGEIDWVQTDGVSHHQTSQNAGRKAYKVSISDGDIESQGTAFEVKIKDTDTSILVLKDQIKATYKDKSTAEAKAGEEILINPVGRRVKPIEDQELKDEWTLNNLKEDQKNNLPIDPNVLAKAGIEAQKIDNAEKTASNTENGGDQKEENDQPESNISVSQNQDQPSNINLQVKQNSNGVLLNWSGDKGSIESWKIIKGTGSELTYPSDSYRTVSKDESSYLWEMSGDNNAYYFRLCAFKDNSCVAYSNTASIQVSSSGSSGSVSSSSDTASSDTSASTAQNQNTSDKSGSTTRKQCENSGGHWTKATGNCKCPPKEVFVSSVGRCKKK